MKIFVGIEIEIEAHIFQLVFMSQEISITEPSTSNDKSTNQ